MGFRNVVASRRRFAISWYVQVTEFRFGQRIKECVVVDFFHPTRRAIRGRGIDVRRCPTALVKRPHRLLADRADAIQRTRGRLDRLESTALEFTFSRHWKLYSVVAIVAFGVLDSLRV